MKRFRPAGHYATAREAREALMELHDLDIMIQPRYDHTTPGSPAYMELQFIMAQLDARFEDVYQQLQQLNKEKTNND